MNDDAVRTTEPARRMSIGPTLLGGIVGAAVGVGLHLILETGILGTQPYEASWFAIVIGLITGLGVRWANKHHMERSYARGAVSAVIALGAIVLSTVLISQVMANKQEAAKKQTKPPAAAPAESDEAAEDADGEAAATDADAADETDEPAAEPAARPAERPAAPAQRITRAGPDKLNPWQFVFMALGGLVAYEFGRGIDHSRRAAPTAGEPAP